jgi:hypothetical protein
MQEVTVDGTRGERRRPSREADDKRRSHDEEKEVEEDDDDDEAQPAAVPFLPMSAAPENQSTALPRPSSAQRAAASLQALQATMRQNREELALVQQRLQR